MTGFYDLIPKHQTHHSYALRSGPVINRQFLYFAYIGRRYFYDFFIAGAVHLLAHNRRWLLWPIDHLSKEVTQMDIAYLLLTTAFFALSALLPRACELLRNQS